MSENDVSKKAPRQCSRLPSHTHTHAHTHTHTKHTLMQLSGLDHESHSTEQQLEQLAATMEDNRAAWVQATTAREEVQQQVCVFVCGFACVLACMCVHRGVYACVAAEVQATTAQGEVQQQACSVCVCACVCACLCVCACTYVCVVSA